ncbi:MAG: protein kinase [Chloroflexi bacterium]|nr:protein kinase [Chloroflexota bacterium]
MAFETGSQVGQYIIEEKLGQGGMATVYKARHQRLNRLVAIKVLHPAFKDDESFLRRFTREAQVVAQLEHPNIVPVYDFAEFEGLPYLVMRYVDGETLKDAENRGQLSLTEINRITQAVAAALDYAHGQGVLHRDVKPSNILLTRGGGVYMADFGLARMTEAGESTMSQDMIMGTPQYISPEQAKGVKELDGRTDIYSFGIVVYEMLTGQVPFQSDTGYSIIHSQIFDPPPSPSALNDKISPQMEAVLLKVLSKEPEDRYAAAGEFYAAFKQAASDMPSQIAPVGAAVLPDSTEGLTRAADTPPPPLPDLTNAPASEVTAVSPEAATEQPAKKKRPYGKLIIGIGILLALCLVGSLVVAILNDSGDDTAPPPNTAEPAPPEVDQPPAGDGRPGPLPAADLILPESVRPLEELLPLVEANPDDPQLRLELAAAYAQAGDIDQARAILRDLIRPVRTPLGIIVLSNRLLEQGRYEMAVPVLEEGLNKFPEEIDLQQMLMMAYILNQQSNRRINEYLGMLAERPHSPATIAIGEAYILYDQGNIGDAFTRLEDYLNSADQVDFPDQILFMMGVLLWEAGENEAALELFHGAMEQQPPSWLATLIEENIIELEQDQ